MRKYLRGAGIPAPNRELLDIIAPAILSDEHGGRIRQWKYSSAELKPIIEAMKPDFEELDACTHDPEQFQVRLEAAKEKFYGLLRELDSERSTGKFGEKED